MKVLPRVCEQRNIELSKGGADRALQIHRLLKAAVVEQFIAISAVARTECRAHSAGREIEQLAVGNHFQIARFGIRIRRRCGADRTARDGGSLVGDVAPAESGIQACLPLARKLKGKAGEHIELPRMREQAGFVGGSGNGGVHLAPGKGAGQVERQHIAEFLLAIQVQAVPLRSGIDVVRPDCNVPGKVLVYRSEVGLLQELVAGHQMAPLPGPAGGL
ncbi:hypothetical protein G6F65_019194 [Rhizopus arrhizus]|nr:hypothetical protein G6F65_019194 [Rhizopus arrhizus]